jgi:hypothetical protein
MFLLGFQTLQDSIFSLCTLAPIDTDDNKQIMTIKVMNHKKHILKGPRIFQKLPVFSSYAQIVHVLYILVYIF